MKKRKKPPPGLPTKLVKAREDRDLTQEQAAAKVGVGRRMWIRYELGYEPSPAVKILLLQFIAGKL